MSWKQYEQWQGAVLKNNSGKKSDYGLVTSGMDFYTEENSRKSKGF